MGFDDSSYRNLHSQLLGEFNFDLYRFSATLPSTLFKAPMNLYRFSEKAAQSVKLICDIRYVSHYGLTTLLEPILHIVQLKKHK